MSDIKYTDLAAESYVIGELNDCTVKAIAIACNVPYKIAHKAMADVGRKKGHGAPLFKTIAAVESLGFTVKQHWTWDPYYRSIIASYPKPHYNLKHITTYHPIRFAEAWADKPPMIFSMVGHVAGFRNGHLSDWSRTRYKQVRSILVVSPKEENND